MQNGDFWTRATSLYGCQTSPVVLCLQNNVRITSLYRSQPSPVVFACKTATFGPELQVSMSTRPHLSFCARKTAWLAPKKLVPMWPSPHLLILDAKQRLLYQNNKSLWVQDLAPVVLCKQNSVICSRMRSLYFFYPQVKSFLNVYEWDNKKE